MAMAGATLVARVKHEYLAECFHLACGAGRRCLNGAGLPPSDEEHLAVVNT